MISAWREMNNLHYKALIYRQHNNNKLNFAQCTRKENCERSGSPVFFQSPNHVFLTLSTSY